MERSDTPSPAASPPLQPSPFHRSGLDHLLAKLPGTAVQLFTIQKLSQALLVSLQGPSVDRQWPWALLGTLIVIVVPATASSAFDFLGRFLSKPRT